MPGEADGRVVETPDTRLPVRASLSPRPWPPAALTHISLGLHGGGPGARQSRRGGHTVTGLLMARGTTLGGTHQPTSLGIPQPQPASRQDPAHLLH